MADRQFIKVGRGHDVDIRVTDISVSRFHAKINQGPFGEFYVEDNKSKFGTLLQVRHPVKLLKDKTNYFQMGRTYVQISIQDDSKKKKENPCLDKLKAKLCPCIKQESKNINENWRNNNFPSEFEKPIKPEIVDEKKGLLTQLESNNNVEEVERTRDEDLLNQPNNNTP